jgi:hypothetical protein
MADGDCADIHREQASAANNRSPCSIASRRARAERFGPVKLSIKTEVSRSVLFGLTVTAVRPIFWRAVL